MAMSNGVTGGVFDTLADLQKSRPRDKTIVQLTNGAKYKVVTSDTGANLPFENGNFAEPIEPITPQHFGALADGVAIDTSPIQKAINFSKPVLFPSGTYIIDSAINLSVSISGEGATIKRSDGTSFSNLLLLNAVGNISIKDIRIDGNKDNAAGGFTNIQIQGGCFNVNVENCETVNAVGYGVSITNSDSCTVRNCLVDNNALTGVEVRSSTNSKVLSNRISGGTKGIDFTRDVNNNQVAVISDNIISSTSGNGISIPRDIDTSVPYSSDVTVTGNTVRLCQTNGFLIQCNRGTVSGNVSRSNGTTNIHQGFVINGTDIAITGNVSEFNTGVGIDLGNASYCTVSDNVIRSNGIIGLEINSSDNIVADGNLISNNYTSNPAFSIQAGLIVNGLGTQWPTIKSNRVKVSNNIVTGGPNQTHGIHVKDSEQVTVENNDCFASGSVADLGFEVSTENDFVSKGNKVNNPNLTAAATLNIPEGAETLAITSGSGDINDIIKPSTNVVQRFDEITIFTSVSVTFKHNAPGNLRLSGNVDYVAPANSFITFTNLTGAWRETSRS